MCYSTFWYSLPRCFYWHLSQINNPALRINHTKKKKVQVFILMKLLENSQEKESNRYWYCFSSLCSIRIYKIIVLNNIFLYILYKLDSIVSPGDD
jgi:hypothetical protein